MYSNCGAFKYCAFVRRISGPDTHWIQRFIGGFALLFWLLSHNRRSVFPLGAMSLFSLGHGAGTRGEGGCCRDQQGRLKAAGLRGCRGKLGSLCLGATVDLLRPRVGGDRGIWAPVFAVIWRVGERTFFWTCIVRQLLGIISKKTSGKCTLLILMYSGLSTFSTFYRVLKENKLNQCEMKHKSNKPYEKISRRKRLMMRLLFFRCQSIPSNIESPSVLNIVSFLQQMGDCSITVSETVPNNSWREITLTTDPVPYTCFL